MKHGKKLLILAILGMVLLVGCSMERYSVNYNGQKNLFGGAKDSYFVGSQVSLVYDLLGTDTNLKFYVDEVEVAPEWKQDRYIIKFTMPDHDVSVRIDSGSDEKSMMYEELN